MSDSNFMALLRDIIREEICRAVLKPPEGKEWTSFQWDVYRAVWMIPYGQVASYGDVAKKSGHPGAAQSVGNALAALGSDCRYVPWWRVVHSSGRIPEHHSSTVGQLIDRRPLLEIEGINVDETGPVPKVHKRFFCDWSAAKAGLEPPKAVRQRILDEIEK